MLKCCFKLLSILLCIIFVSCEGDYYITYEFTGLELEHAVNDSLPPSPSSMDSIPKKAYVLRMNLFPIELSRDGRYLDAETPPSNRNPPQSILVTSNNDFDSQHLEGDTLNDLFLIFNNNYYYTSTLERLNITNIYNPNFYSEEQALPEYADLLLMKTPTISSEHKFTVKLILADSTVFIDSTTTIKLY